MTNPGSSNADDGARRDEPVEGKPRPSRRRRAAKRTAHGVGILVGEAMTLTLVILFAILIRLQEGPINLSFLAPAIESAVNRGFDGRIEIGGVEVTPHKKGDEPRLQLRDVRLRDAQGRLVLSAPRFSAGFSKAELLSGRLSPTSLTLIGPTAVLTRAPDGSLRIGIGGADSSEDVGEDVESPTDAFSGFIAGLAFPERRRPPFADLSSIAVRDAFLIYRDEVTGRVWRAPDAFLRIWSGEDGARAFVKVSLSGDSPIPTTLTLTGRSLRDEGRLQVRAAFSNISARDLASQVPVLAWLSATDGALDGGLDLEMTPDGALGALSGRLRADSVVTEIGGKETLLDFAEADFSYDVGADAFDIRSLEASALGVSASLSGRVALNMGEDGGLSGLDVTLHDVSATAARPDLFDGEVALRSKDLHAAIDLAAGPSATLDEATVTAFAEGVPETRLRVRGAVKTGPDGLAVSARAESDGFAIGQAIALWPKPMAHNGRLWVAENVPAGRVSNVRATVEMAPGAEPAAQLDFDFADATSTYLKPMPPLIDAAGKAGLKDGVFWMDFAKAKVATEDGTIDLAGSTLELRSLLEGVPIGRPVIHGVGPSAAVLNVIDHEPLKLPGKLGLKPSDIGGDVEADAVLEFPLLANVLLSDVKLNIDARLTAVSMVVPNANKRVEADLVSLTGDEAGMVVTGDARIDGRPATVTWRENFAPGDAPRRTLEFAARVSRDEAVDFGVPAVLFREGAAGLSGQITFTDAQPTRLDAAIDVTQALLESPNIGWLKEAGTPGAIRLSGPIGDALALAVTVDMPGFEGDGTLTLPDNGVRFDIRRLEMARIGEFKGKVLAKENRIEVNLTSPSVDLEPFLSGRATDTSALDAPELLITLNADGAHLSGALWAGALSGRITIKDGHKLASFNGLINGDAPFSGDYTGATDESRLVIRSDEAGRALKALGALQSGRGGRLRLDLQLAGADAPIKGQIHIDDLVITEAPVLAEMLSLASLVGAVDKLTSGGVTFTTIESDFRAEGSVVHIANAAAYGPTVGLTAQGSYDLDAERFNLSGSISPAYVVNGLVNAVPILGEALTGGEGEGVFGIAYELKGSASDPKISVSPLSVLAIGPFRRLFSGDPDNEDGGGPDPEEKTWRDRQLERRAGDN